MTGMASDSEKDSGREGPAGQFCPSCGINNLLTARECEACGEALAGKSDEEGLSAASEERELSAVPAEGRVSLGGFTTQAEAELAAGYLRSAGIAAELGSSIYPGLAQGILWVSQADASDARQLLDQIAAGFGPGGEVDDD